jgi:hypothetical protein
LLVVMCRWCALAVSGGRDAAAEIMTMANITDFFQFFTDHYRDDG